MGVSGIGSPANLRLFQFPRKQKPPDREHRPFQGKAQVLANPPAEPRLRIRICRPNANLDHPCCHARILPRQGRKYPSAFPGFSRIPRHKRSCPGAGPALPQSKHSPLPSVKARVQAGKRVCTSSVRWSILARCKEPSHACFPSLRP